MHTIEHYHKRDEFQHISFRSAVLVDLRVVFEEILRLDHENSRGHVIANRECNRANSPGSRQGLLASPYRPQ